MQLLHLQALPPLCSLKLCAWWGDTTERPSKKKIVGILEEVEDAKDQNSSLTRNNKLNQLISQLMDLLL